MTQPTDDAIAQAILDLTSHRGPGASICPTDAARILDAEAWRTMLGPVRRVAANLARAGRIEILRHGKPIDPGAVRGVIRLRTRVEAAAAAGETA